MRIPIRGPSTVNEKTGSSQASPLHASISLHPVSAKEALIVKVTPPHAPVENIDPTNPPHVACDIVLVIDVSGSMGAPADVPGEVESTGLSVLDLTKHAAMTIIETLNEGDRLGIVTFGSKSNIVLNLTSMDKTNKDKAREKVRDIESRDATNLWHGMLDGIKVLRQGKPSSRVPALMILTDGKPNHMCPEQGYIPKLRSLYPVSGSEKSLPGSEKSLPGSIHTFGFGYNLESGLLKAIAEFGGGNYAFIPDAGMIGTVFVHAVANLQSTFATKAVLTLSYQEPLSLEEIRGDYIGRLAPKSDGPESTLTLELGNLQYGQTRDIYISAKGIGEDPFDEKGVTSVAARLDYFPSGGKRMGSADATCSMLADAELSPNEIAYHESRTLISKFLASIFPANFKDVYQALKHEQLKAKVAELPELIKELPAQKFEDELNKSLVEDLAGEEPRGQISIALRTPEYFRKWGTHYLPSIHNAHTRQICNSFKDSGPQQYGKDSPLFRACRDLLDNAFDQLPAPEPSAPHLRYAASSSPPTSNHHPFSNQPFSMSRYHNPAGSCFAGSTPVELASGRRVAIRKLRRGVKVRTPAGARKVAVVLKTPVTEETMCQVKGGILVTPWHPIAGDTDAKAWGFPAYVTERNVRYTGFVYSVMLQRGDGNPRSHALRVGDVWGVTLGHGIVSGNDSRAHALFGDYRRVAKAFLGMGIDKAGVVVGAGVERDRRTGVVSGFRQPPPLLDQESVVS